MPYIDLHCHLLYGVDDGAQDYRQMCRMADIAYENGTRVLCATPHFNPEIFTHRPEREERAFEELTAYCKEKHPDMTLLLGNEIFIFRDALDLLRAGEARPLGNSNTVLVEFLPDEEFPLMKQALFRLSAAGYRPLLAHAERYSALRTPKNIVELKQQNVRISVNAASVVGKNGFFVKRYVCHLLKHGLVSLVASDGHTSDSTGVIPSLSKCAAYINKHFNPAYTEQLLYTTPKRMLETTPALQTETERV